MNIPTPTSQTVETARSASQSWPKGSWSLGTNSEDSKLYHIEGWSVLLELCSLGRLPVFDSLILHPQSLLSCFLLTFALALVSYRLEGDVSSFCCLSCTQEINFWWEAAPRDSCNWHRAAGGSALLGLGLHGSFCQLPQAHSRPRCALPHFSFDTFSTYI